MTPLFHAWWFLRRGYRLWSGYRTALLLSLVGSLTSLVQFGWTAHFVATGHTFPALIPYGGDLVAYFLVGSAFTAFIGVSLNAFQENMKAEIQIGTLEALLLTDVPLIALAFYLVLWPFTYTLIHTIILSLLAIFLFDISLKFCFASFVLLLFLTVCTLSGIGLASAGVILITKRGDPIHWLFTTLTGLFAGVFYPVETLPARLQLISSLLPTTYALHGMRLAILRRATPSEIASDILVLLLYSFLTLSFGALVLHMGWVRARRAGTLAEH